jgi:hypothetical protein
VARVLSSDDTQLFALVVVVVVEEVLLVLLLSVTAGDGVAYVLTDGGHQLPTKKQRGRGKY